MQMSHRRPTRCAALLAALAALAASLTMLLVPQGASAATYTATVTLDRSLPTTVNVGTPLPGRIDFGRTFSSLEWVCFTVSFGADDLLDVGESFDLHLPDATQYSGIGGIALTEPQPGWTVCSDASQTLDFLGGSQRVEVRAEGWPIQTPDASFTLTELTVTATGQEALKPPPSKRSCDRDGWRRYGDANGAPFRNHGGCVASFHRKGPR